MSRRDGDDAGARQRARQDEGCRKPPSCCQSPTILGDHAVRIQPARTVLGTLLQQGEAWEGFDRDPPSLHGDLKRALAQQAGDIVGLGMAIIRAHLVHYAAEMDEGEYLRPNQLRDLSITIGISRDIHLNYSEGRKGMEIQVDARQPSVLSGLSVEELRAIVASGKEAGEGVDREAEVGGSPDTGGLLRPDMKQISNASLDREPPSLHGDPQVG